MQIKVAEYAGFCYGVKRAFNQIVTVLEDNPEQDIYMLGPIVHNQDVVNYLVNKGAKLVNSIDEVKQGIVFIRAHGVPPDVYRRAAERNIKIIDATCPSVRRVQQIAAQLYKDGYQVLIVGEAGHPEVEGISGCTEDTAVIVNGQADLTLLSDSQKIGIVAQTTQRLPQLQAVVQQVLGIAKEIRVYNTICDATSRRQNAVKELAASVDLVLVLGDPLSKNTRQLAEIAGNCGVDTKLISSADELEKDWFKDYPKIGIAAGASTPAWIIKEVLGKVNEMYDSETEPTKMEEMLQSYNETMRVFQEGDIVSGTVVQINDDGVLVDIGYKSEGFIPYNEINLLPGQELSDVMQVGDQIKVYVLKKEGKEGELILSKRKVDAEQAWVAVEQEFEDKKIIEVVGLEAVKGGLVVNVNNLRGFIPASQLALRFVENVQEFVGQQLRARIIEFNPKKNKIVLSAKTVQAEEQKLKREALLADLAPGQIREGIVKNITNFGAFIDLGGAEGLLHISEMAWSRIKHPSEILAQGDKVKVSVLEVDKETGRISLGLKQTMADPWTAVADKYAVGSIIEGTVTKVLPFGAFVKVTDGIEGLIHISQLAPRRVAKVEDVVNVGDVVKAKVIDINTEERKMALSIKEIEKDIERQEYEDYLADQAEGINESSEKPADDVQPAE